MGHPLLDRITFSPGLFGGLPALSRARLTVLDVLRAMASGDSEDALLARTGGLERDDIRAALFYAATQVDHTSATAMTPPGSFPAIGFPAIGPEGGLLARITFDPDQCHGRPCLRGSRIRVQDMLEKLAYGWGVDEMLEEFEELEADDIRAALTYAAGYVGHPVIVSTAA